jgi:uncharacterized OB-fold protein
MGFEKFGKNGYISQSKITPFISYLEKNQLWTTKCAKCTREYFPPRADCSKCGNNQLDWVQINGTGKLVTFTEVFFAPPSFQPDTPYLLGLIELENGLRAFAPISRQITREKLKPGLDLILRPKHAGDAIFYELNPRDDTDGVET